MTQRKIEYWIIPPESDAEFAANMENVLEIYAKPYDARHPVVCMDEQPVQLIGETRVAIPATKTGCPATAHRCGPNRSPATRSRAAPSGDPRSSRDPRDGPDTTPKSTFACPRACRACYRPGTGSQAPRAPRSTPATISSGS